MKYFVLLLLLTSTVFALGVNIPQEQASASSSNLSDYMYTNGTNSDDVVNFSKGNGANIVYGNEFISTIVSGGIPLQTNYGPTSFSTTAITPFVFANFWGTGYEYTTSGIDQDLLMGVYESNITLNTTVVSDYTGNFSSLYANNLCYSDGTNCTGGGNSSWNESYANTLYQPLEDQRLSTTNSVTFNNVSTTNVSLNNNKIIGNSNDIIFQTNSSSSAFGSGYQNPQLHIRTFDLANAFAGFNAFIPLISEEKNGNEFLGISRYLFVIDKNRLKDGIVWIPHKLYNVLSETRGLGLTFDSTSNTSRIYTTGSNNHLILKAGDTANNNIYLNATKVYVGQGSSQTNITLTSPNGTEYNCGVQNGGAWSCS